MRRSICLLTLLLVAGCGGSNSPETPPDPVQQVPDQPGLREAVREALTPDPASFPAANGQSLQEVANGVGAGPQAALATSVLRVGENRFTFGVIAQGGTPVYGPSAIYIAPTPNEPAQGPFVAPADVLLTEPRYRSKQAATETDPFAAVYSAEVDFSKPGKWAILVATRSGGRLIGSPVQVDVATEEQDLVPDIGERAPVTQTDTLESAKGDAEAIDTREPTTDMHENLADVVGKKPVALLFATPQLCESRVCGPVVDIALQLRAKYGKQMTFIHQEVYVDNELPKGLRPPLKAFNLATEPWLFVIDKRGRVTARLEGSFGVDAFEAAIKTGL